MEPSEIRPGDQVNYIDVDRIRWGPWQVVSVEGRSAVILIDGLTELPISLDHLAKPGDHQG